MKNKQILLIVALLAGCNAFGMYYPTIQDIKAGCNAESLSKFSGAFCERLIAADAYLERAEEKRIAEEFIKLEAAQLARQLARDQAESNREFFYNNHNIEDLRRIKRNIKLQKKQKRLKALAKEKAARETVRQALEKARSGLAEAARVARIRAGFQAALEKQRAARAEMANMAAEDELATQLREAQNAVVVQEDVSSTDSELVTPGVVRKLSFLEASYVQNTSDYYKFIPAASVARTSKSSYAKQNQVIYERLIKIDDFKLFFGKAASGVDYISSNDKYQEINLDLDYNDLDSVWISREDGRSIYIGKMQPVYDTGTFLSEF